MKYINGLFGILLGIWYNYIQNQSQLYFIIIYNTTLKLKENKCMAIILKLSDIHVSSSTCFIIVQFH